MEYGEDGTGIRQIQLQAPEKPVASSTEPGTYGLRALYIRQGKKFITDDSTGADEYVVQLWPTDKMLPLRHIKPKPKPSA